MTDISQGDTADAVAFQPMAVEAYERAEPLDLDGLFHMSLLQRLTDPAAALATAQRILDSNPDHILGLGAAAEAEAQAGQPELATKYYKHLLDVYDAQSKLDLPAYEAHKSLLSEMKAEAEAYLAKK
jgi:tetratricopeptide (TPR) repeat protein